MRSFDELERLYQASPPASPTRGIVRLICVRKVGGVHETPRSVRVTPDEGVAGDRWLDKPGRSLDEQVTLMSHRVAELVAADHAALDAPGDNFLVELDLGESTLPVGTRVRLGGALLEISAKPHAGCKKFRDRFGLDATRWVNDQRSRRLRGVNCRVVAGGEVAIGDVIEVVGPAAG